MERGGASTCHQPDGGLMGTLARMFVKEKGADSESQISGPTVPATESAGRSQIGPWERGLLCMGCWGK